MLLRRLHNVGNAPVTIPLHCTDEGVNNETARHAQIHRSEIRRYALLKSGLSSRNDGGLALDPLMKNRAQFSENIRKWEWGGGGGLWLIWWTREAIMGLIRSQRGSVQRVKLVFWYEVSFFHPTPGIFVYLFLRYIHSLERIRAIWWLVMRKMIKESVALVFCVEKMSEQWVVLSLTMPQCAVFTCMSMSEGVGRGKSRLPVLGTGISAAVSMYYDEMSLHLQFWQPRVF